MFASAFQVGVTPIGKVGFIPTYRLAQSSIATFSNIQQSKLIAPATAEINSKTETTRAMIEKRRASDRGTVIAAFEISQPIPSDCLQIQSPDTDTLCSLSIT
ncbi:MULTISPECIES: hypothetical protein [unclassified Microcoleus]|uniref:hypothetical protein n=1 Tax=unclassified Microcoleus TaxID=2642155 RepID=UPI002FD44809